MAQPKDTLLHIFPYHTAWPDITHNAFLYHTAWPEGTPINIFPYHMSWPKYASPHTTQLGQTVLPIALFHTTWVGQSMALSYHAAWPESTPINILCITQLGQTELPITLLLIPHGLAGLYSLSNFPVPHGLAKVYFSSHHMARPEGTPITPFHTTWLGQGVLPLTILLLSHLFVPHSSAEGTPIALFRTTWLSWTVLPITLSRTTRVGQSILLLIPHSSAGMYSHHNCPYHTSRLEGTPNNNFSYHTGWPMYTSPHTARLGRNVLPSQFSVPHSSAGGYSH